MINNVFSNVCKKMEISEKRVQEISDIKKNITQCIDEYFGNTISMGKSRFIGSYGRNTAVYIENIRLLVVIPSSIYLQMTLDINEILRDMQKALQKKFVVCDRADNGNGLNINMDGDLNFEIVPGFMFDQGVYVYLLNNEWKQLNLGIEREMFNCVNLETNNNLIYLCRMLKIWKNKQNLDISNILLDTFAYHFFDKAVKKIYTFDNFDEMLVDFFNFLLPNCRSDNFISFDGKTILKRRVDLYDKVFFSRNTGEMAKESAECGLFKEAIDDWKQVFGTWYFV